MVPLTSHWTELGLLMRRFAPVAVQWVAGLLEQLDVRRQGIDLLGRDALLLGAPDQPWTSLVGSHAVWLL